MDGETHDSRLGSHTSLNTLSEVMTSVSRRSWRKQFLSGGNVLPFCLVGGGAGVAAVLQMLLCFKEGEKEPHTDAQWLADKVRAVAWQPPERCNCPSRLPNAAPPAAAWLWRVLSGLLRHNTDLVLCPLASSEQTFYSLLGSKTNHGGRDGFPFFIPWTLNGTWPCFLEKQYLWHRVPRI